MDGTLKMMKIPCKDCICLPVCRCKQYKVMIDGCSFIREFLKIGEDKDRLHKRRIINLVSLVRPTEWTIGQELPNGYELILKRTHYYDLR